MTVKQRLFVIVSLGLGLLFGTVRESMVVQAAKSTGNNVGYSVSAVLPENQITREHSFFDLKMVSGQQQTLKVRIYNVTNRDIQIETGIHTAYTNDNGVVEYLATAEQFDTSLKYQLGKLTQIKGESTVTVPANDSKIVEAQVSIPKTTFQGVMLGGWYFKRVDEKVTSEVKEAMNVHNQYAYVVGIKYSLGQAPQPKLTLSTIKPGLVNHHQSTIAELRNTTAVMIPDISLKTTVVDRSTHKTVKTVKKTNVQMVPNTTFYYGFLTGTDSLKPGSYHLRMIANNKAHRWVFEKDFTVTKAEVKQVARKSVESNSLNPLWLVVVGAIGTLIVGGLSGWLIYVIKRRSKHKQD